MKTLLVHGQPSWRFSSDRVEAAVTRTGGHLAPVTFRPGRRTVEPFSVAPWAEEKSISGLPPLLQALRGDFFCAPFGNNDEPARGERHPAHGETAQSDWQFESLTRSETATELHLSLQTKVRPGRVEKMIRLRTCETALYCRHRISGMSGPMNLGHHATLKFPDRPGAGLLSTSRLLYAQVLPTTFEEPVNRGYSSLKPGATFSRLDRVPMVNGGHADLSHYPARRGYEDLAMLVHEARPDFAWTAVSFPEEGYVWFALKDPRVLRSTVLWISNGGRHYPPWNGRHVNVMGLEDVTSYFHYGLAPSIRPNPVNRLGFPTALALSARKPLVVNYIMAVAAIPRGFGRVTTIIAGRDKVTLVSGASRRIVTAVDVDFLYEKSL